jgi:hypothetical protein
LRVQPFRKSARAGVVGSGSEPEITKPAAEFGEESGGLEDRWAGIVRIGKTALRRRLRHELSNSGGTRRAGHIRPEPALLPQHPRQEGGGQSIALGRGIDHPADCLPQVWRSLNLGFRGWRNTRAQRDGDRDKDDEPTT